MTDWIQELQDKRAKKYSQGGQDGIVKSIFDAIGTTNKFCVEFGFNATELDRGSGSNTARLILDHGWTGVLLDDENENVRIGLFKQHLTPENIRDVFARHGVPIEPDYVSIDVDGDDLWLFEAMLWHDYRPRLISVEYNARFPITESVTMKKGCGKWEGDAAYGASLRALKKVGRDYGYGIVAVESGLDLFFVRGVKGLSLDELSKYTDFHVHPIPPLERQQLFIRYPSMETVKEHPWFQDNYIGTGHAEISPVPLMP